VEDIDIEAFYKEIGNEACSRYMSGPFFLGTAYISDPNESFLT